MKKYIIFIIAILLFTSLFSCSDDQRAFYGAGQSFKIINKEGKDLLNPALEGTIDLKKLKVYYLVDNEKIEASEYFKKVSPNSDFYYGYSVIKNMNGEYTLEVSLNDSMRSDGSISYTYIEWDEDHTDVIMAKSTVYGTHYFEVRMIQYNDTPVSAKESSEYFTIVK